MKPIFGIDITFDKKNDTVNGEEFITNTISKQKVEELEEKQENLNQTIEESRLPKLLRIIKFICGIYALFVVLGVVRALPSVNLKQAFQNAPILIISGLLCGLVWVILQFFSKKKEKNILEEKNAERQVLEIDRDIQSIYNELNVPSSAPSVDVLMFKYKTKNDEIVPRAIGLQPTPYINLDLKIYATDRDLCLSDLENTYSFSLSELKDIKTVHKRISVFSWNKEEDPRKGKFKPYKMTINNLGNVFFKPYHILEIEHDGQIFGIYFPCYELETFERLTGLKAN